MQPGKDHPQDKGRDREIQNSLPKDNENVKAAHDEAEKDIEKDPELSASSPNDDLDEGESARLGEEDNGLV